MNNLSKEINSSWLNIDSSRVECTEFLEKNSLPESTIDSVSMVLSELLENAMKFSGSENDTDLINYSVSVNSRNITVEVKNSIYKNQDNHIERLDKTIQWIRGFQNSLEAYIEKLKEVSMQSLTDFNHSGLGLTRIAYEGQSIIDFFVGTDNQIAVSAIYHLREEM